jgi:hypothetical protein
MEGEEAEGENMVRIQKKKKRRTICKRLSSRNIQSPRTYRPSIHYRSYTVTNHTADYPSVSKYLHQTPSLHHPPIEISQPYGSHPRNKATQ